MATEKAHDIMRYHHNPLNFMFAPKSVALIGLQKKKAVSGVHYFGI